jgi:hypothetical protein
MFGCQAFAPPPSSHRASCRRSRAPQAPPPHALARLARPHDSRSRSSLHYDPYQNLLAVVTGAKRVTLFSPEATPAMYPQSVRAPSSPKAGRLTAGRYEGASRRARPGAKRARAEGMAGPVARCGLRGRTGPPPAAPARTRCASLVPDAASRPQPLGESPNHSAVNFSSPCDAAHPLFR